MTRVAVVGSGKWGGNLVRAFHQSGALWGVADSAPERLAAIRELYPGIRTVQSLDEVLARDVEAVAVATPAATHFELCRKALLAGRHVFVEKPITLNIEEAEELAALSEGRERVLMVGHLLLYHPAVRYMKRAIESGELGEALYLYGRRVNLGQVRQEENALWSLGPHDISIALFLFDDFPQRVSATGACYIQPSLGVEDVVFLNLAFGDGRMAHFQLSWLDPHKERLTVLVGSRRMAVFDDAAPTGKLKIIDKRIDGPLADGDPDRPVTLHRGEARVPELDRSPPLTLEVRHFLDCIARNRRPLSDGRNGLAVLRVLDAAQRSLKQGGRPVEPKFRS